MADDKTDADIAKAQAERAAELRRRIDGLDSGESLYPQTPRELTDLAAEEAMRDSGETSKDADK